MKILLSYLKKYWPLVILALFLAAINQCFSLMDPYIFGKMLNKFGVGYAAYLGKGSLFVKEISLYLCATMGVAMVSRIAKNFQDYFTNVIIQRTGAQMYNDGIQRSLELPYQDFEDQRSGETLGKLQKVRDDIQKFVQAFISILFTTLVGVVIITVYSVRIYWLIAPVYFAMIPVLGFVSSFLSKKIKIIQRNGA